MGGSMSIWIDAESMRHTAEATDLAAIVSRG